MGASDTLDLLFSDYVQLILVARDVHNIIGRMQPFQQQGQTGVDSVEDRLPQLNANLLQKGEETKKKYHFKHKYTDEHTIELSELCRRLGSHLEDGLTSHQAAQKLRTVGPNEIPSRWISSNSVKFLLQMTAPFALFLWAAAALSFAAYHLDPSGEWLGLGCALITINVITGIFTFALRKTPPEPTRINALPSTCKVLREGRITMLLSSRLVPGDIVEIISGDVVHADIRIIQANQLKFNNSMISEDEDEDEREAEVACTHADVLKSRNICFSQTVCVEGRGRGVVIGTGRKTVFSLNRSVLDKPYNKKASLGLQIDRLVRVISIFTLSVFALVLLAVLFSGFTLYECLIILSGLLIASIPEGLLVFITISLSCTIFKLQKIKVLLKSFSDVATLAQVTCLCTNQESGMQEDKFKVTSLFYDNVEHTTQNEKSDNFEFSPQQNTVSQSFNLLRACAMVHNDARIDANQEQQRKTGFWETEIPIIGNFDDVALLTFYRRLNKAGQGFPLNKYAVLQDNTYVKAFSVRRQCKISIEKIDDVLSPYVAYVKGSLNNVWKSCNKKIIKGSVCNLSRDEIKMKGLSDKVSERGERLLAFAMLPLDNYDKDHRFSKADIDQIYDSRNFTFVGAISFIRPYLSGIPRAIEACHLFGIKLIIFSQSYPQQSCAFAKNIGAIAQRANLEQIVINKQVVEDAFDRSKHEGRRMLEQLCERQQIIFSKIRPINKFETVKALQRLGHLVAATGDGCWVATCSHADLGISMAGGLESEFSDAVVLDDDLGSMVNAFEEGRKAVENIRNVIQYQLTSNFGEICPFVASALFQIPLPLSSMLALWLTIGTDFYCSLALALEEPEVSVGSSYRRDNIIPLRVLAESYGVAGVIESAAGLFAYNLIMDCYGFPLEVYLGLLAAPAYTPRSGPSFNTYLGDPSETFRLGTAFLGYSNSEGGSTFYDGACSVEQIGAHQGFPNWFTTASSSVDLRAVYVSCCADATQTNYCPLFNWPPYSSVLHSISPVSGHEVAYTTEAIFYAQSGYFSTVAMMQCSNIFALKSNRRRAEMSTNWHVLIGIAVSVGLVGLVLYVPGWNGWFGGRPLPFLLLVPGSVFSVLLLLYSSLRRRMKA